VQTVTNKYAVTNFFGLGFLCGAVHLILFLKGQPICLASQSVLSFSPRSGVFSSNQLAAGRRHFESIKCYGQSMCLASKYFCPSKVCYGLHLITQYGRFKAGWGLVIYKLFIRKIFQVHRAPRDIQPFKVPFYLYKPLLHTPSRFRAAPSCTSPLPRDFP
jgi:hypothetical protein